MPAEALLHAEDDALDAIRLAVESRGDAGGGSNEEIIELFRGTCVCP